jgi:hypothetical protein
MDVSWRVTRQAKDLENWGKMMVRRFFPRQDLGQARQLKDRTKRSKIENRGADHGHLYNLRPFRA